MKLLIVDDDSLICSALARALIRLGHAARAAGTIESALRLIESEAPAAILTDLDLGPGGDGVDLITRLRQQGSLVPAIMMTGSDPVMARARLARVGLEDIALLEKPFAFDELMKVLDEVLPATDGAPAGTSSVAPPRMTPVAVMMSSVARTFGGGRAV